MHEHIAQLHQEPHGSFMFVTWLIHACDVTRLYVQRDSFIWALAPSCVWHASFICVTWLIHCRRQRCASTWHSRTHLWKWTIRACDMTHMWHGRINVCDMTHSSQAAKVREHLTQLRTEQGLIHVCDVTHSYAWRDTLICVAWRIHVWDLTHSYV